jgi:hypothetical protein
MSGTVVLEPATLARRPGRGLATLIGATLVAAVFFVAVAALPYFTFLFDSTPGRFVEEVRFGIYYPRRGWLLLHIAGGMLALLAGPVQLWLGLTDRRMDLHRVFGTVYLAGVALGTVGAVVLAVQTTLGWTFGAGLLGLAFAWVVTTGLAFASIKKHLIEQHKEWMIRSYVVTFAFVVFRVGVVGFVATGVGETPESLSFLAWVCWAVPLLVTEAFLQGRKILAVAS